MENSNNPRCDKKAVAVIATQETIANQTWYVDSRATNTTTIDPSNLSTSVKYNSN